MFRRILIANRGEVVARVLRTTKRLGIEAVVVVSEADRDAPYTRDADQVVCLGPPPAGKSYLDRLAVIQAAVQTGATAVHPGWGFLSEDPLFADLCQAHGLSFVGPAGAVMRRMGQKIEAKRAAKAAGLDVIPGSDGALTSVEHALEVAEQVGYPVILKADSGGGGRGMRRCADPAALREAFPLAQAEALAAFGDPNVYLERFLASGRHVEFQLIADAYGTAVHLGERECSIQRKHQKLLEESPSPALSDAQRDATGRAAARLAASIGYVGAGTIEFLLDPDGALRFMEMNTRLQVEHPITEARCGLDLVELQLRVAANEPLGLSQEEVAWDGHAIEVRLNAEDPAQGFRPSPGTIAGLTWPPETRVDTHVAQGYTVPPHYDSLIAKLIVHAPDRAGCIARMEAALEALVVDGVATTRPVLQRVLAEPGFRQGSYDTRTLEALMAADGGES